MNARTLLLPLLLLLAACGGAPKAPEAAGGLRVERLDPGVTPVVTLRLLFQSGAADDPAGKEGLTALTARLMAEGGTESLDAYTLKQTLYPWAARVEVQVDQDMTVFVAQVHRDHLDGLLPILADVLVRPRFAPAEFERLRRDAIDDIEKRLRSNDDENLGKEALNLVLYQGHEYGHFAGGTVAALKGLTLDDVKAQARAAFTRARLTIGIAGGAPDDLPQRLGSALAGLPAGTPPATRKTGGGMPDVRMLLVEKPALAAAISMGHTVTWRRDDPDFFALMVAFSAFGEHRQFHGRLMQRLRELRGLNYGDYAYPEHFVQEGWSTFAAVNVGRQQQYMSIWLRPVKADNARFALRLALHEYEKLMRDGFTAEEVDTAKRFLAGYTRLWDKNDSRRLGNRLDDVFYGTPDRLKRFREALPGITVEQVNAALRAHLPPVEALKIVVVTGDAAAFKQAILDGTPTPLEYNAPKPEAQIAEDKVVSVRPFGIPAEAIKIVPATDLF